MILAFILPILVAAYYFNTAKKYNKNKIGYAMLGFFAPLFPFILFSIFIVIAHFVLGHDPKFKIGKTLFTIGIGIYGVLVLLFPQYLKMKWTNTENHIIGEDILDSKIT